MPELVNSQRRINKATYVNIRAANTDEDQLRKAQIRRPLEKVNFIRSLQLSGAELAKINGQFDQPGADEGRQKYAALLKLAEALSKDLSPASNLRVASTVARIHPQTLADFGRLVAGSRRKLGKEAQSEFKQIHQKYARYLNQGATSPVDVEAAPVSSPKGSVQSHSSRMVMAKSHPILQPNAGFARPTRLSAPSLADPNQNGKGNPDLNPTEATAKPYSVATSAAHTPSIKEAFDWALEQNDPKALELNELARTLQRRSLESVSWYAIEGLPERLERLANQTDEAVNGFVEQFRIEPIGRLHLERLDMTPVGVERGELVYSIPLAPKETVNIGHKEWSIKSEEFEKIVQDSLEEFSEEGVTEKNDLSQSTESQNRHATAFSLSGSYSGYGASISVGYNSSSEDQQAQKDSRQQSITLTRKASARAKKEHKQSFKVTSVVGAEDQSVRVITNPSETAAMRVDYYQLMRKWRVDLYRYDLRMTYDIVIPSPGADLLQELDELRALDQSIEMPFDFSLPVSAITPENWADLAARYGANVPSPPEAKKHLMESQELREMSTSEEWSGVEINALILNVDDDYEVETAIFVARHNYKGDRDKSNVTVSDQGKLLDRNPGVSSKFELTGLIGKSGELSVIYSRRYVGQGQVYAELTLVPKQSTMERWQFAAWGAMREAAETAHYENRQTLTERREKLEEEIKGWDALTLRKMEREEIMKGVLRWLFGPEFELVPSEIERFFEPVNGSGPAWSKKRGPRAVSWLAGLLGGDKHEAKDPAFLEVLTPTEENWERVMRFGELIKFLHHAIEWENVVYFTYPYFWDSPDNWNFKRFLQHPDSLHREFLRAGSARVVLTIRPGYEEDFAKFVELGGLGDDHPYLTIAEEIQSYARTNYPGVPPANPPGNFRPLLMPKQIKAWQDLQRFKILLEKHYEEHGSYPLETEWMDVVKSCAQTLADAKELDPWGEPWDRETIPDLDPWGQKWNYIYPGVYNDFDLASYGANGELGGEGEDADITSWAEASLIGRWYEYTPTSALDISIDTTLTELA